MEDPDEFGLESDFLKDVGVELNKARSKFPGNEHRHAALCEEAGELAAALLAHSYGNATPAEVWYEAVQVAAMALRVAVEGDRAFPYKPPRFSGD